MFARSFVADHDFSRRLLLLRLRKSGAGSQQTNHAEHHRQFLHGASPFPGGPISIVPVDPSPVAPTRRFGIFLRSPMVYRFRQFEVDSDGGCLRRDGAEVPLRRKALLVLLVLIERRGRLVSKEELFATVWPDTAVTDDVLAGVISELRKA